MTSRLWMKSNATATTDGARLETVSLKAALPAAEAARAESVAADEEDAGGQEEPRLLPEADVRTNFAETAFFYPHLRTDEKGTEAASVTGIEMDGAADGDNAASTVIPFYVDRPFLFLITERSTGTVLFIGRMGAMA